MRVSFVRHGATEWNHDGRFQGHADIALSEEGREQAERLSRYFRGETFDRVIASDLSRAHETARIIAPHRRIERDARWREFDFGAWEGLTWEQIVELDPSLADANPSVTKIYVPPEGETYDEVRARVREALADLRTRGENVLVVTHAGPLHAMLDELFGGIEVRFVPASVTRIALQPAAAELLLLNDAVANRPNWE